MDWRKAKFKGKEVWVQVTPDGQPVVERGRVPMRYSKRSGAKVYRGGADKLSMIDGAGIESLDEGVSADAAKKKGGRSKGRKKGSGFGSAGTRTKAQQAAAAADVRQRLEALEEGTAVAYTDGGCRRNPGPAGSGVRLELADGRVVEASRSLGRGTNNIAELTAIGMALELLDEAEVPADAPVLILSDSNYARGVLTQGWKAKKNTELIVGLREALAQRPGVELQWVAGHAGIAGNERADALASAGVEGQTATTWS